MAFEAGKAFVLHFVALYRHRGMGNDLLQSGYEGLLKAFKNYSHDKGTSFTTYAGHCILGEIRHFIRREARYYRPVVLYRMQDIADGYYIRHREWPDADCISFTNPIEDRLAIEQAVGKLSGLTKKVILLLYYKGFTQQKAANELGINQRKVSRLLSRGLEELRRELKPCGNNAGL